MEISKEKIQCPEIKQRINRMSTVIQKFIQLVNYKLPKEIRLNEKCFIITRKQANSYLNDGKTICDGFHYWIYWSYTFGGEKIIKEDVIKLNQRKAITFVLNCKERCYDHSEYGSYYFSLYFRGDDKQKSVEKISSIPNSLILSSFDEYYLFKPYELMQVVWRIWNVSGLYHSKISDKEEQFDEMNPFLATEKLNFTADKVFEQMEGKLSDKMLSQTEKFSTLVQRFTHGINYYVSSYLTSKEPTAFLSMRKPHYMFQPNERKTSFRLLNCFRMICGYSYCNDFFTLKGISQNLYPCLLYFTYYVSSDFKTTYYTISMTSCNRKSDEIDMELIEATSLEELLNKENMIAVAKWLEEACIKRDLMEEFSHFIQEKGISNFKSSCEILA